MDRKRLALLIAVAVLAVVGYAAGAFGRPADDQGGTSAWRDRLAGRSSSDALQPADLRRTSGTCQWEGAVLRVPAGCTLTVAPRDSGVTRPLMPPVRQASLRSSEPVRVAMLVEGKRIEMDLDPGKDLRLTAGPAGAQLTLACRAAAPTPCLVTLVGG